MQSHMLPVTIMFDKIGNLLVWTGHIFPSYADMHSAGYVQNSQDIEATLGYTDISVDDRNDLASGYPIHTTMVDDCLCILLEIEY